MRSACGERYYNAQFRHTRGLDVEADESVAAFAFDSPAGPAVVVAAPEKGAKVKVSIDTDTFNPSSQKKGKILTLDGKTKLINKTDRQQFQLGRNDIAVWLP